MDIRLERARVSVGCRSLTGVSAGAACQNPSRKLALMEQQVAERPQMPPQYDPAAAESRWYPVWVERGYFSADAQTDCEPYCIVIPPPNVTGALHVGHALGRTMEDTLIRRARMRGF